MSFECWILPHFIWSHRIAAYLGNCSLHPTVTAVCVIPSSQLISCLLSFFTSSQLFAAHVILCQLIWCTFISFENNLPPCGISWLFISCHTFWSLIGFFLHLPFNLFPKSSNTAAAFPCRRHERFRVVVSAVSDPWVHWDTHSKPSRREAPTQKGFYTAKLLHTASFHTENPLHTEAFTHCKLLHKASFYTEQALTQS